MICCMTLPSSRLHILGLICKVVVVYLEQILHDKLGTKSSLLLLSCSKCYFHGIFLVENVICAIKLFTSLLLMLFITFVKLLEDKQGKLFWHFQVMQDQSQSWLKRMLEMIWICPLMMKIGSIKLYRLDIIIVYVIT